ncbi:COG1361 family protein [Tuwongella immobilis]|uniref:DUF11 domain-containing protein n=1 Tax=Tuwongella immobilis TaxID=692036 RepID=A0A6C2YKW5_9BACT|nr:DUF11 domain-containing protein [Tuwongella immobilis]VIP01753.1 repeat domain protein : 60 kDa outer membrane protein OS=Blastopirellula marina DSM 3645 GN=DSM3645_12081 PE=4 SV=1: DUF11: DUF11 [Tuwongella immobilis]VTR99346.1 repeat domain protein : 60 kDa outer membrane protein OS=Blastopirellula marina DSM 3645 GN=DSM3645_12081 PE=4 SV=1: DUF11: DUF11 [Tuwongella immobilis]
MIRTTLLLIALGLVLPGRLTAQPVGPPPNFTPTEEPPLADPMSAPRLQPNLVQPNPVQPNSGDLPAAPARATPSPSSTPPPQPITPQPFPVNPESAAPLPGGMADSTIPPPNPGGNPPSDSQVEPAQYVLPSNPYGTPVGGFMGGAGVPTRMPMLGESDGWDPPTPVVGVRVVAPATLPVGKDLTIRLVVENRSRARANHVEVRAPLPLGTQLASANPEPSEKKPTELLWKFGSLDAAARKDIVVTLRILDATEVTMTARVKFEHGQTVTTKLAKPSLKVRRVGPTEGVLFDPFVVRLEVTNTGVLPLNEVEVSETLTDGLEFDRAMPAVTQVGQRWPSFPADRIRTNPQGNLRTWYVGVLQPRQTQVLEYRLVPKKSGNLMGRAVASSNGVRDEANGPISVLEPKLGVQVEGPKTAFVGQPATYRVTVNNLGDLTLNNVRVLAELPVGCQPLRMSNDGQIFRDAVQWIVTKLEPGGSRTMSLTLRCPSPGVRRTRFTVRADRGLEQVGESETTFDGVAALNWNAQSEPTNVKVGDEFTYKITVHNSGSAPATNLAITADLPTSVEFRSAEPAYQPAANVIRYTPITLPAGETATFRFTVRAARSAQAVFKLDMLADHLDQSQPVRSEPSTTIRSN